LVVSNSIDLQLKLNWDPMGSVNDPSSLASKLQKTFELRKEQHAYKVGLETSNLPEDERVEKTVVIKAYRSCRYGDVIKIIDVVKGAGASPIILQIDDLP
jgi:biopolymer transport protein ExbD